MKPVNQKAIRALAAAVIERACRDARGEIESQHCKRAGFQALRADRFRRDAIDWFTRAEHRGSRTFFASLVGLNEADIVAGFQRLNTPLPREDVQGFPLRRLRFVRELALAGRGA